MQERLNPLRAVFMGTPEFAATILRHVLADPIVEVVAVYSQPDRPAGRGKGLKAPEVKILALEHDLPVEQPLNFKTNDKIEHLAAYKPDVLLVAAYGLILPQAVLDIPRIMPINVHASLLPRLRGAAPIQRAIMEGQVVTGITIMHMEAGLDSGPILLQRSLGIGINDTSETLHKELADLGGTLLVESLHRLTTSGLQTLWQNDDLATFAPKLRKEESIIDLNMPAKQIHAIVRGLTPWPGASLMFYRDCQEPMRVQIAPGQLLSSTYVAGQDNPVPGTILGLEGEALLIATGDAPYALTSLCPSGKKPMSGRAFYNGYIGKSGQARFLPKG